MWRREGGPRVNCMVQARTQRTHIYVPAQWHVLNTSESDYLDRRAWARQGPRYEVDPGFGALYNASQRQGRASYSGIDPMGSGSDFTVFLQRIGVSKFFTVLHIWRFDLDI